MSLGDLQAAVEVVNIFFIVYMAAMQCNQAVLFALGWRETSDYVKRKVMRDDPDAWLPGVSSATSS